MDNYIVIEGKRIELPNDFVDHIREQLKENEYIHFVSDTSYFEVNMLPMKDFCEIGKNSVPLDLRGRCLVLHSAYEWDVIANPSGDDSWAKLLVATKK